MHTVEAEHYIENTDMTSLKVKCLLMLCMEVYRNTAFLFGETMQSCSQLTGVAATPWHGYTLIWHLLHRYMYYMQMELQQIL